MRTGWRAAVLLVGLVLVSSLGAGQQLPIATGPPWMVWTVQTVDLVREVSSDISIALDSAGHPHVAYTADGGIGYAKFSGLSWELTVVPVIGAVPSLALDEMDRPLISYWVASSTNPQPWAGDLNYTYFDGERWVQETVDSAFGIKFSHLRLDGEGRPHIGYVDALPPAPHLLKYAYRDSEGWHVETVASNAYVWNDLDLDPSGAPRIAYAICCTFWGQVGYATRSGDGSWSVEVVAEKGGADLSLAVDDNGNPHVAYSGEGETLAYATLSGSSWLVEIADTTDAPTGYYTSIGTDSANRPHISYWQVFNRGNTNDPLRGHLKYATKLPDGTWSREFVDRLAVTGATALAIDELGRPHVAYQLRYYPLLATSVSRADLAYAEPASATVLGQLGG